MVHLRVTFTIASELIIKHDLNLDELCVNKMESRIENITNSVTVSNRTK